MPCSSFVYAYIVFKAVFNIKQRLNMFVMYGLKMNQMVSVFKLMYNLV